MKTVEEIRRARLRQLVEEVGSAAEINRRSGRNERDSTLSQILNQAKGSSGKPKYMGSTLARDLEKAMGKPRGWMDNDPELSSAHRWPFATITPSQYALLSEHERGMVEERVHVILEYKLFHNRGNSPASSSHPMTSVPLLIPKNRL